MLAIGLLNRRGTRSLHSRAAGLAQAECTHVKTNSLTLDNMNERLKTMEYAVRGEVPLRAAQIEKELAAGKKFPFEKIMYCNIGNPQAVGKPFNTFYRAVSSLVDNPTLFDKASPEELNKLFGEEEVYRAREILSYTKNTGAYSDSMGVAGIRNNVARFIEERDGYSADPDNIFLSNGASSSIQWMLTAIIAGPRDAVLIPIPQYPIYTALIALLGGHGEGYYMQEKENWALREEELERSHQAALAAGKNPRAFVLINPGNPTGNTLSYEDLATVVSFCHRHNLVLLADEVYQENTYNPSRKFTSAKKVMRDLDLNIELASFHSTSKGFLGECGRRGGYMEMVNFDAGVKAQIVKLASSALCSNLNGQVMTDLMVKGPRRGTKAFDRFVQERDAVLGDLKMAADFLHDRLNAIEGISCQPLEGAMYAFPRIQLPPAFEAKAKAMGKKPDALYALMLLENTGICTVPGSGFEQQPGTYHIRMTFLPQIDQLRIAMDRFDEFHRSICSLK